MIDQNNVKKAINFSYDELPNLKSLEQVKVLYHGKKPEVFLYDIRRRPWEFNDDLVLAVKTAGYIRDDGLYISQALYRLLDGVLPEPRPQDLIVGKYIHNNDEYENFVSLPEKVIDNITNFLWTFGGTNTVRRLSDNERLILFEYFAIDHKPLKSESLEDFGYKHCYQQDDPVDGATRCLAAALGKLKKYGNHFTELYAMNPDKKPYIEELRDKLAELIDPDPEMLAREKLKEYAKACKDLDINTNYDFVDIRYVFLDPNVSRKLMAANICNLQQLIDAYGGDSAKAKFGEASRDYDSFKRVARNFLFRYGISVPECMR